MSDRDTVGQSRKGAGFFRSPAHASFIVTKAVRFLYEMSRCEVKLTIRDLLVDFLKFDLTQRSPKIPLALENPLKNPS